MPITINSEEKLCEELNINDLYDISNSEQLQNEVAKRLLNLSPELIKSLIGAVPELAKTFQNTVAAMEGIGKSLEESKQIRWKVLRDLAQAGRMTGDQILEAMKIIAEIEKREHVDWNSILKNALKIGGVALVAFVGIIIVSLWPKEES